MLGLTIDKTAASSGSLADRRKAKSQGKVDTEVALGNRQAHKPKLTVMD